MHCSRACICSAGNAIRTTMALSRDNCLCVGSNLGPPIALSTTATQHDYIGLHWPLSVVCCFEKFMCVRLRKAREQHTQVIHIYTCIHTSYLHTSYLHPQRLHTYLHTYFLTDLLAYSQSITHPLTPSLTQSLTQSFALLLIHSLTYVPTYLLTYLLS